MMGCGTLPDASHENGTVLLAVVWLMAALALIVFCFSQSLLDELQLVQDRQQAVQGRVALENDWQCQWWWWLHHTQRFPQPLVSCGVSDMQVEWVASAISCATAEGEQCQGAWITLRRMKYDHCQQLRQFVLQRNRFAHGQWVETELWRGQRLWQSCSLTSS